VPLALGVESEADPRVLQRPLPALGGLEEVCPARLEIEQEQGTVAVCRVDVGLDVAAQDVVTVVAGGVAVLEGVGHGDDELVHRHQGLAAPQEGHSCALDPLERRVGVGLPEHAESARAGCAVVGGQEPQLGEDGLAAARETRGPARGRRFVDRSRRWRHRDERQARECMGDERSDECPSPPSHVEKIATSVTSPLSRST